MSETDPRSEPVTTDDRDAAAASAESVSTPQSGGTAEEAAGTGNGSAAIEGVADVPAGAAESPAGAVSNEPEAGAGEPGAGEARLEEETPEAIAEDVEAAAEPVAAGEIVQVTEAAEVEAPVAEESAPGEADALIEPAVEPEPEAAAEAVEPEADDEAAPEAVAEEAVAEEAVAEPAAETEEESAPATPADEEQPAPSIGVPGMDWYIIHSYSGFENKVRESLRTRADAFGFGERIGEILIPTEDVVEMRNGKKVTSKRLLYPGYVLVQLKLDDELWHVVKNTPRVTGFVGGGQSPTPLSADEVNQILFRQTSSEERPRPKLSFDKNDRVKIIDGPFTNFTGAVEEVNTDRNTLKVMVTIFGRATPVELEYFQVEKEQI